MIGERTIRQSSLFYGFSLEDHVPLDHLLRSMDRFVEPSDIRRQLAPPYSAMGRPFVGPELMIRMLLIGYCSVVVACPRTRGPHPRREERRHASTTAGDREGPAQAHACDAGGPTARGAPQVDHRKGIARPGGNVCTVNAQGAGNGFVVSTFSPPPSILAPSGNQALYTCPPRTSAGFYAMCDGGICFTSTEGQSLPGLGKLGKEQIVCSCPVCKPTCGRRRWATRSSRPTRARRPSSRTARARSPTRTTARPSPPARPPARCGSTPCC